MNIITAMYLSLISVGENINISSNNKAQLQGLGKVRKYSNYQENVHTVGLRYTRPSALAFHKLYIGGNSLV